MLKNTYYSSKNNYACPSSCTPDMDECPNHPDLYLLRDAAADERGAIADYLTCAADTCLEIFLDVAKDEMQHFVETMRLISLFDPVQAQRLQEEDLGVLTMERTIRKPKWVPSKITPYDQDVQVTPPNKKDLPAIRCLTKAIQDELHAINKYQKYMNQADDPRVMEHFCKLMNEEKEHVAEFTAALFKLTNEPLPEESD